ncbi:MAG: site-specific integrase [Chloroflexota bacterium]
MFTASPAHPQTVFDGIDPFLQHLVVAGKADHTVISSRLDLQQLARFVGKQRLATIASADIDAFVVWLERQQGNGLSSVRRKVATVKKFFQFLAINGFLTEDPAAPIPYPPAPERETRALTVAESEGMVRAAGSTLWTALVTCLLDCGLKRDELVALRWTDASIESTPHPVIQIRHRQSSQRARHRVLDITDRFGQALQRLREERDLGESIFGISPRGVDFIVETVGRRADVRSHRKVTPQMLRDRYALNRMRRLIEIERELAADPDVRSARAREHDVILLRELGLSERSAVAARCRALLSGNETDRGE